MNLDNGSFERMRLEAIERATKAACDAVKFLNMVDPTSRWTIRKGQHSLDHMTGRLKKDRHAPFNP